MMKYNHGKRITVISVRIKTRISFIRLKQYLCMFVLLFVEIESLRKRLNYKENEIDILRKTHLSAYLKR